MYVLYNDSPPDHSDPGIVRIYESLIRATLALEMFQAEHPYDTQYYTVQSWGIER